MSEYKNLIVKSPIAPVEIPDPDFTTYTNRVAYYVRLPDGVIVTNPEDFPIDTK